MTLSHEEFQRRLAQNAYPGYVYGYPHKKAYRAIDTPLTLEEAWRGEPRDNLYCYVHIPFCNQRCSFCNLFTYVPGDGSITLRYLDAVAREMHAYAGVLGSFRFRRLYLGGGTPTYLDVGELQILLRSLKDILGVAPEQTEGCIEASPETLDEDRILFLREAGFQRISLGVQSLVEEELRSVNRRFDFARNSRAIELVGKGRFPHFNIDLIYGLPDQSEASWLHSLEAAVASEATSLFLYPLYVRPLTGLDHRRRPDEATLHMGRLYDIALEHLSRAGFRQLSMRQFRRDPEAGWGEDDQDYRCQRDGMIGLGAGARSYTHRVHYSTPWRMVARNIRAVVDDYCQRMSNNDTGVTHGFLMDEDERRRRYVIQSLLSSGLNPDDFDRTFGASARECFAEVWQVLEEAGCVRDDGGRIVLTPRGVRHADVVGTMFFSERVRQRIEEYEYDR